MKKENGSHVYNSLREDLDPLMWAIPMVWPNDEASHVAGLASPGDTYAEMLWRIRNATPPAVAR